MKKLITNRWIKYLFACHFRFLANEYPESLIINLLQDATKAAFGNEKVCPANY